MMENPAYKLISEKPFDTVVDNIERLTAEHKFRVLAVHNVQHTLAEKGLERPPLKIIEVCNATFAHEALKKDVAAAMFMPCKFTVHTDDKKTVVTLARPEMISQMLPNSGLEQLASQVETTLKAIMTESV